MSESPNDTDRRKSLDRHSSSKSNSDNINNNSTSANSIDESPKSNKSFGFMSLFKKPSEIPVSSFSWMSLRSEKVQNPNLNLENLDKITTPSEAVAALKNSLDVKTDEYYHSCLDLITHLCEQDPTKVVAAELGNLGACSIIDQILGLKISSSQSCESCLRAMCSLITPPDAELIASHPRFAGTDLGASRAGVSSNCRKFSSSGTIYRIVKGGHTHISDVIVLEWGLRVVYYISLEEGEKYRCIFVAECSQLLS